MWEEVEVGGEERVERMVMVVMVMVVMMSVDGWF